MNYNELMEKLKAARDISGTDRMLVKVAIPVEEERVFSDQSPEPVKTYQVFDHLDVVDITPYPYQDSGQTDWVVYIKAEKKENK